LGLELIELGLTLIIHQAAFQACTSVGGQFTVIFADRSASIGQAMDFSQSTKLPRNLPHHHLAP
jgi:hypothetical protein